MAKVLRLIEGEEWANALHYTETGLRHKSVGNAMLFLENMPEMKGAFRFNTFTKEIEIVRAWPWESETERAMTESDVTNIIRWLESLGQFGINTNLAFSAIQAVAERSSHNPLQTWLRGLEWDGIERIDKWLSDYLGCPEDDYAAAIGPRFLIGCVARAMKPGSKFDNMLILEGPQGIMKSTCLAALFGADYFTDEISDFGTKDAAMQLQGVWCVEVAELSSFTRSAAERTKEFVSRRVDRIRPPYGRMLVKWPRTAVMVGTTNETSGYFQDHTGNRRFWPVQCREINLEALKQWRTQIWAEAKHRYSSGDRWWLEGEEVDTARKEQDARFDEDAWHDTIKAYVAGWSSITQNSIFTDCLKLEIGQVTDQQKKRIGRTLRHLGWSVRVSKDSDRKSFRTWTVDKPAAPTLPIEEN